MEALVPGLRVISNVGWLLLVRITATSYYLLVHGAAILSSF